MKHLFAALLFLAFAVRLAGQASSTKTDIEAKCDEYLKTPLPAEAASISTPKTWPECASYKLYSGIGAKVNYDAARRCAWAERLAIQADIEPRYTVASVAGGSAMLAVLYANGEGVDQNIPLAGRFACEAGIGNAVKDIEALPSKPIAERTRFKYCDEVGTTMEIGFCAGWDSELQDQARRNWVDTLSARWSTAQRTALLELARTDDLYSTARARGELDLSGSGRAIWEFDAEWLLRERFKAALKAFESGHLPSVAKPNSAGADADLNRIYRKAIATAEAGKSGYGAVQPDGIRDAERAWLKYRDAWLAFAKLRYPSVTSAVWMTLLTRDRIDILNDTFCEMGSADAHCDEKDSAKVPPPLP